MQLATFLTDCIIPMAHVPETDAIIDSIFRRQFLVRVSCAGTSFVWYQIPAPIGTVFYSKPESGVHVTGMMTYDWSAIAYVLMCFFVI